MVYRPGMVLFLASCWMILYCWYKDILRQVNKQYLFLTIYAMPWYTGLYVFKHTSTLFLKRRDTERHNVTTSPKIKRCEDNFSCPNLHSYSHLNHATKVKGRHLPLTWSHHTASSPPLPNTHHSPPSSNSGLRALRCPLVASNTVCYCHCHCYLSFFASCMQLVSTRSSISIC